MPASSLQPLRQAIERRTLAIVPELVALTDAFGFSDWELNSTLGGIAGRPYEALFEQAERDKHLNLGDREYIEDVRGILDDGRQGLAASRSRL